MFSVIFAENNIEGRRRKRGEEKCSIADMNSIVTARAMYGLFHVHSLRDDRTQLNKGTVVRTGGRSRSGLFASKVETRARGAPQLIAGGHRNVG